MADKESKGAIGSEDRSKDQDPITKGKGVNAPEARDMIAEQMDRFLTFNDLSDEEQVLDLESLQREQNNPFSNYPVRQIRQRVYPRNPILDGLDTGGLLEYCRVHEFIHASKMVCETIRDPKNPNVNTTRIAPGCKMNREEILSFIEERETLTFPSYSIVFCEYRRKKSVPHSRSIMSYINNHFYDVFFDKKWILPDGKARRGWFAIVEDHTIRSQLIFRFHPKKRGKLTIDRRYTFLKGDVQQLAPLKETFLIIQKSRKTIRDAFVQSSGDKTEDDIYSSKDEIAI